LIKENKVIKMHLEGAAREAIVKADLLRKGFEVYGAEGGNSSFDLVAYKYSTLLRVEVKGAQTGPRTGPVSSMDRKTGVCLKFDVMARVAGNSVCYLRSIIHTLNEASKELVGEEIQSKNTTKKNLQRRKEMLQ
jgi:hypothetical protein